MKILLVEDNEEISNNIKRLLKTYDDTFSIKQVFTIKDAKNILVKNKYNLILLDLMLPDGDGINLAKKIKKLLEIPIIMMTAKWEDDDKINWLEAGADDYIVKPFKVKELYLRITNIIKKDNISDKIKIWNIEIDFESKKVYKDWQEIHLKLKEFQILEYLYNVKTASRLDIIEEIWWDENTFSADNKLDVNISSIRKKLWKNIIETIKWFGYSIKNKD